MSAKKKSRTVAAAGPANRTKRILTLAKKLHPELIKVRRRLHERPELSFEEFATTKYLTSELARINLKPFKTGLPTGVVTELKGAHAGPTIAVRTDIDALPILEKNNIPFASKTPGRMHACGHDVHMTRCVGMCVFCFNMPRRSRQAVRVS